MLSAVPPFGKTRVSLLEFGVRDWCFNSPRRLGWKHEVFELLRPMCAARDQQNLFRRLPQASTIEAQRKHICACTGQDARKTRQTRKRAHAYTSTEGYHELEHSRIHICQPALSQNKLVGSLSGARTSFKTMPHWLSGGLIFRTIARVS